MSKLYLGKWEDNYYPASLPQHVYEWPMYVLGLSGTGKSTLLANLALRLHQAGEGVLVIDHKDGQLASDIASRADPATLVYISPGQCFFDGIPHHWGLNVMEVRRRDRLGFATTYANTMKMFERMERANFDFMARMRLHLDTAIRLALYTKGSTLDDVLRILTEQAYRKQLVADDRLPEKLRDHFTRFDDNKQTTAYSRNQAVNSSIPRLMEFLTDQQLNYTVTQPESTIHLADWLDAGYLVVCDLATDLTQVQSELLGNLLLAMYLNATFTRQASDTSRIWRLIADEFDQLAGDNFIQLIDKARAYRSIPVMANQSTSQLIDGDNTKLLRAAVSVPVKLTFRVSEEDAKYASWVRRDDLRDMLTTLPRFEAVLTLKDGLPGLLDAGESELVLLDPLQGDDDEAALEAAILSQKSHTVSERVLAKRGTIEGTNDQQKPNPPRPDQPAHSRRSVQPGDDRTVDVGAGDADGIPGSDQPADGPAIVFEPTQHQGGSANYRRKRPKGRQPQVPEPAEGSGTGGGQGDAEAEATPGQVGAELPDEEGTRHTGRSTGKPQPGSAPPPSKSGKADSHRS